MLTVQDKPTCWQVGHIDAARVGATGLVESTQWVKEFPTFGDLPKETQTAVALLTMCADNERMPGVGRRVSATVFWLEASKEMLREYREV